MQRMLLTILLKKGMAFRDAHEVIGKLVLYCVTHSKDLENLSLDEYQAIHPIFEEDIYEAISLITCVNERKVKGGPSKEAVTAHLHAADTFLNNL